MKMKMKTTPIEESAMSTLTVPTTKPACIVLEENVEIPMHIQSLADFRHWAHSDEFPERGRIDFLGHRIEVDMSPEDLFSHGSAKMEIGTVLYLHVQDHDLGFVFSDSTRISSPLAELSAEPDIVFLSHKTLESEKARLVPKATGAPGRFVEIEGAVDLVVEILSDSSVTKDTRRLPPAYFAAGVCELWLVDARGDEPQFQIHHRGQTGFGPVAPDEEGFQTSGVFEHRYRLERQTTSRGHWRFDLKIAK
jgi:Uma2 family endonuclease